MLDRAISFIYCENVFYVLLTILVLFAILIYRERNRLMDFLSCMDRKSLILVLVLWTLGVAIPLFLHTLGSRQNWPFMITAKTFLSEGGVTYGAQHGPLFPFFLALSYIFGLSYNSIFYVNIFFFGLAAILLFFLAYLFFEDEKIGILAMLVFFFLNYYSSVAGYRKNLVEVSQFFLVLTFLTIYLSLKTGRKEDYAVAFLSLGFASLVKFEFMALFPFFLITIYWFNKEKFGSLADLFNFYKEKLLLPSLLFLALPFPIYLVAATSYVEIFQEVLSFGQIPDPGGSFFSIATFRRNLGDSLRHWLTFPLSYILLLIGIGLLRLKNETRKVLFLLTASGFVIFPYLFWNRGYFKEYQIYIIIPLILIAALSPEVLYRFYARLKKKNTEKIRILFLVLLFVPLVVQYPGIIQDMSDIEKKNSIEPELIEISREVRCSSRECMLLVPNHFSKKKMEVLTDVSVVSIEDMARGLPPRGDSRRSLPKLYHRLEENRSMFLDLFSRKKVIYLLEEDEIRRHQPGVDLIYYHKIIGLLKNEFKAKEVSSQGEFGIYRIKE